MRRVGALIVDGGAEISQDLVVCQDLFLPNATITTGTPVEWSAINGRIGPNASSRRFKRSIHPIEQDDVERLMELRPVSFIFREDGDNTINYGLIAEEVETIFPELIAYDKDGNAYSVRYNTLISLLLAHNQSQQKQINNQSQSIEKLSSELAALKNMVMKFAQGK